MHCVVFAGCERRGPRSTNRQNRERFDHRTGLMGCCKGAQVADLQGPPCRQPRHHPWAGLCWRCLLATEPHQAPPAEQRFQQAVGFICMHGCTALHDTTSGAPELQAGLNLQQLSWQCEWQGVDFCKLPCDLAWSTLAMQRGVRQRPIPQLEACSLYSTYGRALQLCWAADWRAG